MWKCFSYTTIVILLYKLIVHVKERDSFTTTQTNENFNSSKLFVKFLNYYSVRLMAGRGRGVSADDLPVQGGRSKPRIAQTAGREKFYGS